MARSTAILRGALGAAAVAAAFVPPVLGLGPTIFDPPPGTVKPGCGKPPPADGTASPPPTPGPDGHVYCVPLEQVQKLHEVEDRFKSFQSQYDAIAGAIDGVDLGTDGGAAWKAASDKMAAALATLKKQELQAQSSGAVDITTSVNGVLNQLFQARLMLDDVREAAGLPPLVAVNNASGDRPKDNGNGDPPPPPPQEYQLGNNPTAAPPPDPKAAATAMGAIPNVTKTLRAQQDPARTPLLASAAGGAGGTADPKTAASSGSSAARAPAAERARAGAQTALPSDPAADPAQPLKAGDTSTVRAARAREAAREEGALDEGRPLAGPPVPSPERSRDQVTLARQALAHGDYAKAERLARGALALDPKNADAFELLAWAQLKQGRYADALASAKAAAELRPGRAAAHALVAYADQALGRYEDALKALMKAAELDARYRPQLERARQGKLVFTQDADDQLILSGELYRLSAGGPLWHWVALFLLGAAVACGAFLRRRTLADRPGTAG